MSFWKAVWILLGTHAYTHCGPKHALQTGDPLPLLRVWYAARTDTRQMLPPEGPNIMAPHKRKAPKATTLFRSRRGILIPLAAHSQLQTANQRYNAEQWPHELRKKCAKKNNLAPSAVQVDILSATTEGPSQRSGGVCALFMALIRRLLSLFNEHIT